MDTRCLLFLLLPEERNVATAVVVVDVLVTRRDLLVRARTSLAGTEGTMPVLVTKIVVQLNGYISKKVKTSWRLYMGNQRTLKTDRSSKRI
jgi:hypothetical protein